MIGQKEVEVKPNVIIINSSDNVAVALENIKQGENVCLPDNRSFEALSDILYSHKVLLADIEADSDIVKYGEVIGQSKSSLKQGEWVHTHNMKIDEE
jgi:altronate dehydratase